MLQIGNSIYAKTGFGEFFYLNSDVDADLALVNVPKGRYDILKAEPLTKVLSGYFEIGSDKTRKIADFSKIRFVDSMGFDLLKKLQNEYRDMKFIFNDEVLELLELPEIPDTFSLENGIPIDVYNKLQSFREQLKGVDWKEYKTYEHSPASQ